MAIYHAEHADNTTVAACSDRTLSLTPMPTCLGCPNVRNGVRGYACARLKHFLTPCFVRTLWEKHLNEFWEDNA